MKCADALRATRKRPVFDLHVCACVCEAKTSKRPARWAGKQAQRGGRKRGREREREVECVPYWRIAYFRLGKAADLSNLNLKESELQQQQHQEREREREMRGQFGCYLSGILNMATKDRQRQRATRERAKRLINNYVIFSIVVVARSLSLSLSLSLPT